MEPTCDHTYTTRGGRVFRCLLNPHSENRGHYFVRDKSLEGKQTRGHLIVVPGERR